MADRVRLTEAQIRKKAQDDGFLHGLAYAAAWLARDRGEDSEAGYLLGESGHSVEDFRKAKVAGYDMRVISRLYRTEPFLETKRVRALLSNAKTGE